MKKWQRTLLIGFIWGCIWVWWFFRTLLLTNWYFDIFQWMIEKDGNFGWLFLIDEFRKGWVIKETSQVLFFVLLVSGWIIYFAGWHFFLKIEWLKLMRRNVNRLIYFLTGGETIRKSTGKIKVKKQSSKTTRPRAMESAIGRPANKESELKVPVEEPKVPNGRSNNAPSYSAPKETPFDKGFNLPSMQQGFSIAPAQSNPMPTFDEAAWSGMGRNSFDDGSMDDILLSDIKLPERVKVEENIPELFEKAGYTVKQNVMVDGMPVEYLAISANRVIVAVEDTQSGDWLADEERFNGEDPLWFSESSHRISPVFQLMDMVKGFMSRLSENGFSGSIVPMFIERGGMIINAEDMQQTWKDLSAVVCRTDLGGPDELKTVKQSIIPAEPADATIVGQVEAAMQ